MLGTSRTGSIPSNDSEIRLPTVLPRRGYFTHC